MALNEKELGKIVNDYYDIVYKFCVSRCGNSDDALDLTREVFLLLFKKSDELNNDGQILAWLFKASDLKVKEYFRKKQKERRHIVFADCRNFADQSEETVSVEDFEKRLDEFQKKIFDVLTDREKEVFVKRYLEKKDVEIVADELGISENAVNVTSSRVKKKARKIAKTMNLLINVAWIKLFL